jgi:hypothetical protein
MNYNHVSLTFDEQLQQFFSFGRRYQHNPLDAGFIKEYMCHFTLGRDKEVKVRLYKIPLTSEQYEIGKARLEQINNDGEYLYNTLSLLTFPVFRGFQTYKAYTCVEFVAHMLVDMGVIPSDLKRCCKYTPDEMGEVLSDNLVYEGNLFDYCTYSEENAENFLRKPNYRHRVKTWLVMPPRLLYRKVRHASVS